MLSVVDAQSVAGRYKSRLLGHGRLMVGGLIAFHLGSSGIDWGNQWAVHIFVVASVGDGERDGF